MYFKVKYILLLLFKKNFNNGIVLSNCILLIIDYYIMINGIGGYWVWKKVF